MVSFSRLLRERPKLLDNGRSLFYENDFARFFGPSAIKQRPSLTVPAAIFLLGLGLVGVATLYNFQKPDIGIIEHYPLMSEDVSPKRRWKLAAPYSHQPWNQEEMWQNSQMYKHVQLVRGGLEEKALREKRIEGRPTLKSYIREKEGHGEH